MSVIFHDENVGVNGSAFHSDGRLFVVCLTGEILVIEPRDYTTTKLYPMYENEKLTMNDLVFDKQGNIYITHFTGTVMEPTGGVFRISADARIVHPVVLHLASPNGVSISPEGNVLWIGESARNSVLRIMLLEDGVTCRPLIGVLPVYQTEGVPDRTPIRWTPRATCISASPGKAGSSSQCPGNTGGECGNSRS
jgi:sugar lactone lactonase YvrE